MRPAGLAALAVACANTQPSQDPDIDTYTILTGDGDGDGGDDGDSGMTTTGGTGAGGLTTGGTLATGGDLATGGTASGGGLATGGTASGGSVASGGTSSGGSSMSSGGSGSGSMGAGGTPAPMLSPGDTLEVTIAESAVTELTSGLNGWGYDYSDCDGDAAPVPCSTQTLVQSAGQLCSSGTVQQGNGGTVWGAGIGFSLNDGGTLDFATQGIVGINFTVSGATRPSALQVVFAGEGIPDDAPYVEVDATASTEHTIYFAAADYQQYATDRAFVDFDNVTDLTFKVPANDASTTPFDYCVSDIELIYGGDAQGGVALTPNQDAWIGPTSNTLGYEGSFWTYGDGSSSLTPTPNEGVNVFQGAITGGEVCMSGSLATYSEPPRNWGGGLGVSFGTGFNASADNVIGFRYELVDNGAGVNDVFDLEGDRQGLSFFVGSGAGPTSSSAEQIAVAGSQVVLFDDLSGTVDQSNIVQIQWQGSADGDSAKTFDFCIRNLEAIVAP